LVSESAPQVAYFFPLSPPQRRDQAGVARMTTLQQIELQCPICETRFRSQTVVSTNSFGGKRTDFHERAAGTQPLPFLIHTCNRCGFSGSERDFTEDVEVSPVLKERVWNELAPARSEEHTSELQSRSDLVCRLLLEKKKTQ